MLRKLFFVVILALMLAAALPAWAAPEWNSYVKFENGILYCVAYFQPVHVNIPPNVLMAGQLIECWESADDKGTVKETITARFAKLSPGQTYDLKLSRGQGEYAYSLLIAAAQGPATIIYQIGGQEPQHLEVPVVANCGELKINWPELGVEAWGGVSYSFSGDLPIVPVGTPEIRSAGGHRTEVRRYRYWSVPGELLEGTAVFSFAFPPDRTGQAGIRYTFPFCPASLKTWLAGSPASATPPSGPIPGGPGSGGPARFWPILPAAPIVLGWVLARRNIDVWLEAAESGTIYVRRGRRGFGRVRAVVSFTGDEDVRREVEVVLGRGQTRQVEAPADWQVAELSTPGRRNKGAPSRLEREAPQDD